MIMGFEAEPEPTSAPKLSLFSLPNQSPEPTGMLTPPLRPPASVPFLWEEAPGKPRGGCTENRRNDVARCLELPPRLLSEVKITEIPSPTTVLEGPYVTGRSSSFSSASFSKERFSDTSHINNKVTGKGYFGNWVKTNTNSSSFRGFGQSAEDNIVVSHCSSSCSVSSSAFLTEVVVNGGGDENFTKVKITRFRRRGSFLGRLSNTSSQMWASIYGTFKQLVPWKRRKINRNLKRKEEESRNKPNSTAI